MVKQVVLLEQKAYDREQISVIQPKILYINKIKAIMTVNQKVIKKR